MKRGKEDGKTDKGVCGADGGHAFYDGHLTRGVILYGCAGAGGESEVTRDRSQGDRRRNRDKAVGSSGLYRGGYFGCEGESNRGAGGQKGADACRA